MKASELVARLQTEIADHGDMMIFQGDMEAVEVGVQEACEQPEVYGNKFLFISKL